MICTHLDSRELRANVLGTKVEEYKSRKIDARRRWKGFMRNKLIINIISFRGEFSVISSSGFNLFS
jgi:hypothetical protein